jgi:hypothetical protein
MPKPKLEGGQCLIIIGTEGQAGRLTPKQIVVAAMRKLLVICFGVLKTGKPFDPAIAMPA